MSKPRQCANIKFFAKIQSKLMLGVGMSDKMAFIVDTKARRRRFLSELILQIFTLFWFA